MRPRDRYRAEILRLHFWNWNGRSVLVTGGTCAGYNQPGTLQFTTANTHSAGYSVSSASRGLQEAIIAARITPTNPTTTSQSGKVIVPPGELKVFARVSIRASNITVDFSGSIIECWVADTCIFAGDTANSNLFSDITLMNPRGRPAVVGGQFRFIETNAQKTRVPNVDMRAGNTGGTFGTYVQIDDDQSFLLDGLDTLLHHLDIPRGMAEIRRVLKPGGSVIVKEPVRFSKLAGRLRKLFPSQRDTSDNEHPLTREEVERMKACSESIRAKRRRRQRCFFSKRLSRSGRH